MGGYVEEKPKYEELEEAVKALEKEAEGLKNAERALKANEELNQQIYRKLRDGIWIYNLTTDRFTFRSEVLHHMSGYTPEEESNLGLADIFPTDHLQLAMETFLREIERDGQDGVDPDRRILLELEQMRKDRSLQPIEVTASFLRNNKGEITDILGVTRDITERKKAQKEKDRLLNELK